jgi:hypothetical protein
MAMVSEYLSSRANAGCHLGAISTAISDVLETCASTLYRLEKQAIRDEPHEFTDDGYVQDKSQPRSWVPS